MNGRDLYQFTPDRWRLGQTVTEDPGVASVSQPAEEAYTARRAQEAVDWNTLGTMLEWGAFPGPLATGADRLALYMNERTRLEAAPEGSIEESGTFFPNFWRAFKGARAVGVKNPQAAARRASGGGLPLPVTRESLQIDWDPASPGGWTTARVATTPPLASMEPVKLGEMMVKTNPTARTAYVGSLAAEPDVVLTPGEWRTTRDAVTDFLRAWGIQGLGSHPASRSRARLFGPQYAEPPQRNLMEFGPWR
jgi:hypothetical protein